MEKDLSSRTAAESQSPAEEAVRTAKSLADSLSESLLALSDGLKEARVYGSSNRKSILAIRKVTIALVVSLILDVSLTIVIGFLAVSQGNTTNQLHSQQVAACLTGNKMRQTVVGIWESNIDTFHNTAAGVAFLNTVKRDYAPTNCAKVFPG